MGRARKLTALIEALAGDPGVGRVLVLYDAAVDAEDWAAVLQAVKVADADVTVASTLPELVSEGALAGLRSGIRAMRALRAPRPLQARTDGGRMLGEAETKVVLRAAGIAVPDGELTDDAVATWRTLGGPVAVKRLGVTHKAREGGVVLDLDDEHSVRTAAERLGPRVLVERMAPRGTEVLVAIRRDGLVPVLVVGAGGVHTEHRDDVAVVPLPADEDRVKAALKTLRTPIPPEPIARLAIRLQDLPLALIELNPVIVHASQAVAVDALPRRNDTHERDRGEAGRGRPAEAGQSARIDRLGRGDRRRRPQRPDRGGLPGPSRAIGPRARAKGAARRSLHARAPVPGQALFREPVRLRRRPARRGRDPGAAAAPTRLRVLRRRPEPPVKA